VSASAIRKNRLAARHRFCGSFFNSLPDVRELLRTDIEAAYEGDPAALYSEEIILSYPFIEAIAIQRLAHVFILRARRSFRA
jgi:serine O-acetyltransferase